MNTCYSPIRQVKVLNLVGLALAFLALSYIW
jgi:hypothetical protein